MIKIIPYLRNKISISLVLSAIALLTISSLPPHSPLLLQPSQATNIAPTSVQTDSPATLGTSCSGAPDAALTFNATGTPSSSDPQSATLTDGTFQITNSSSSGGQILWSGSVLSGSITPDSRGGDWDVSIDYRRNEPIGACGSSGDLLIQTTCPGGLGTQIALSIEGEDGPFATISGTVDCDTGGDTTTAQPTSSMTAGAPQDNDRDGIPDSSDKCIHNSNPRCFKEGDTGTATQSSTSNRTGNQTR